MTEELTINQALNLAVKNHTEGKLREAEIIYKKILEKDLCNVDALHLLGVIDHQLGRYKDAIINIKKAIQLNGNNAVFFTNLGMAYDALEKEEESAQNFKKALEIDPNHKNAHLAYYNLGVYYAGKGNILKALEFYKGAVALNKDFFEARWNMGLILLLLGRFKEGWEEYEYRFKKKSPTDSRVFSKPKWGVASLKGKKILVLSEQGFGDSIHFIRYLPLIKEKGAYVILECKKEVRGLFENFPGIDEFVDKGINSSSSIAFDFYVHLMSLPGLFNTDINNIPNKIPYLKADPKLVEKFKEQFTGNNFKVGIVWAGNPHQENDKNRSTKFERFKVLEEIPGVLLYSLQKGEASRQLDDSIVMNMADQINCFSDTAAIIENLDLIISVDTSVAHLAGAMGKPIWTLLTFMPDWRYLLDREDSPWYSSMKLFRQPKSGDWDYVFNEVRKQLFNLVG